MERLIIVEEILQTIRKENMEKTVLENKESEKSGSAILKLAGVIDEAEANVMARAIEESRKIDKW